MNKSILLVLGLVLLFRFQNVIYSAFSDEVAHIFFVLLGDEINSAHKD